MSINCHMIEMKHNFILIALFYCLTTDHGECKSESFWYPVWYTKNLGPGPNEDVKIGSNTYHLPLTSTDNPIHIDLIPENTDLATNGFPKRVDFLTLRNKQCLLKIPVKRGKRRYERRFVGISEGVFPHPENKDRFVVCHKKRNGDMECLEIDCLKGTYYDSKNNICRYKNRDSMKPFVQNRN